MDEREVTVTLTVPEALYALNAVGRQVILSRALVSGDEWLDRTARRLYESAQRKLELALYPDPVLRAKIQPMLGWDPAEQ